MFSLRLRCPRVNAEFVSVDLWEAGATALSEEDEGDYVILVAGFESADTGAELTERFASFQPELKRDQTDWVEATQKAWPAREIGQRLFLAPSWCDDKTPEGRVRLVHNPGQASGTGEHPCTQLALVALETAVFPKCRVLDMGTGSGILAIAALHLGAETAIGIDNDEEALQTARENFQLNGFAGNLAAASADAIAAERFDITVANISATVLLSIVDDLLQATKLGGTLILTGFPNWEAEALLGFFPGAETTYSGEWACLRSTFGSPMVS